MTLLNGGQRGGNSPTKLRVLGAARKSEVKATQNLSIIVAFFALCWMPLYTINCVQAFCSECTVPASLIHMCIILSHLNSAGNPLLYAYHLKDFRNAFKSLLVCKSRRLRRQRNTTSACTTVAAVGNAMATGTGNDCSVSSLTYSGGSVDCWSMWSVKGIAGSLSMARTQSGEIFKTGSSNTTSVTWIDPSAPVLLSVRQLVE